MRTLTQLLGVRRLAFPGIVVALATLFLSKPASAQSVTVCYVPASGTLYLINVPGAPTSCHAPAHVQLQLASTGAPGPQGPVGPQGPAGPQGPQGIAGGLSGMEFHFAAVPSLPEGNLSLGVFRATCSVPTKSVLHFGWDINRSQQPVISSRPANVSGRIEWVFTSTIGTNWSFYWTCADGVITP